MNGPHDLGGDQGFGPLPLEQDEPVFHADWERRVLALTLAMGATGQWNLDMTRSVRESLPPARYLSSSYYEIWFEALLILLERQGLLSAAERQAVDSGKLAALTQPAAASAALSVLRPERVAATLAAGSPTARPGGAARFKPGDRVRVRLMNPRGHTRVPRYIRGRPGVITLVHGNHVFPDRHAQGERDAVGVLYTVRFAAVDLWGADTTAEAISVDCWDAYLEPAVLATAVDLAAASSEGSGRDEVAVAASSAVTAVAS